MVADHEFHLGSAGLPMNTQKAIFQTDASNVKLGPYGRLLCFYVNSNAITFVTVSQMLFERGYFFSSTVTCDRLYHTHSSVDSVSCVQPGHPLSGSSYTQGSPDIHSILTHFCLLSLERCRASFMWCLELHVWQTFTCLQGLSQDEKKRQKQFGHKTNAVDQSQDPKI